MVNQNSHSENKEAAVEALLKGSEKFHGIDINSKDYMGRSVLMNAVNNVDIEMVRHLFKVDEENDNVGPLRIDDTDHWGGTALHLIVRAPFKLAGEYGADVNVVSPDSFSNGLPNRKAGYSALDIAVEQKAYLTSLERDVYYYDMVIQFLCNNGGQQFKTENVC
ncbi:Oidioi.mRNA.OKI2018_I69.XSR.g16465.t1.cds [Oikopleura dioica]|uniref:Oidioi.mRNA.OKI2018_I69.XSR.g16465.t1.cds n=1 Tax=Oikopleura dioica TaxID=34765 RepID=A0ABN7SMJ7_OIKDI|nr:Oidioi.mRNA.OKI2018_I69.XSR.g16465.t1.cds [Oikopleura dioica]